jgi:hypothetical protein
MSGICCGCGAGCRLAYLRIGIWNGCDRDDVGGDGRNRAGGLWWMFAHREVRLAGADVCRNGGGSAQPGERVSPKRGFAFEIISGLDEAAGALCVVASGEGRQGGADVCRNGGGKRSTWRPYVTKSPYWICAGCQLCLELGAG